MNAFKQLPHSFEPGRVVQPPRANPLLAKKARNKRRNRRAHFVATMRAFGAEMAQKPRVTAVRAWLKRWWIWAASRIGAEPQPPRESCWRMRDPRFWAAARRHAQVPETVEARTKISDRVRGALGRAMGR